MKQQFDANKSLLQRLINAGYPKEDIHHYNSDLYIYVTPLTTKIVDEWCKDNGFRKSWHCPIFIDQITGKKMYDCAFCYYEIEEENQ